MSNLFLLLPNIVEIWHSFAVFHSYFSEFNRAKNQLVMENLRDQGYKPLRPETCGLVFMRAAISSLAVVHATAYAYQHRLGGKEAFLERYPLIKEDNLPKISEIKVRTYQLT